tara:strand:- start:1955 stop:2326 length:372 start_codon:yes stop_codon:yes gene_type:complete
MAHTITLIADHLGSDAPRVVGTEYVVDALIAVDTVGDGGEPILLSSLGLSSVSAVHILGTNRPADYLVSTKILGDGSYYRMDGVNIVKDGFLLSFTSLDGTNATADNTDITNTNLRVRVHGQI